MKLHEEFKLFENMWESAPKAVAKKTNQLCSVVFDDEYQVFVGTKNECEDWLKKANGDTADRLSIKNTAQVMMQEAITAQESQNLTGVAAEHNHVLYFVELYYCLMSRLAKHFNVNTSQSDFWNTLAYDIVDDINYDGLTNLNDLKVARANAFQQELSRNMNADEQSMFDAIFAAIPSFFEIDSSLDYCKTLVYQSSSDLYDLEVSGWYSDDIDFDDCEEAFEAGWNGEKVNWSQVAHSRGYSDWIDAMQSIYRTGKASKEFFDYLDTL